MHTHLTFISTSERLSRLDIEIYEVGHKKCLAVDGDEKKLDGAESDFWAGFQQIYRLIQDELSENQRVCKIWT
jgi:hypothetical protein